MTRFPDSAEFWGYQTVWVVFFGRDPIIPTNSGVRIWGGNRKLFFFGGWQWFASPWGGTLRGVLSYLACVRRLARKAAKIGSLDNHQRLRAKFDEWHRQSLGRNASHETKLGQDQPRNFRRRKLTIGFHPLGIFAKKHLAFPSCRTNIGPHSQNGGWQRHPGLNVCFPPSLWGRVDFLPAGVGLLSAHQSKWWQHAVVGACHDGDWAAETLDVLQGTWGGFNSKQWEFQVIQAVTFLYPIWKSLITFQRVT